MKTTKTKWKTFRSSRTTIKQLLSLLGIAALAMVADAATITKAKNSIDLSLPDSWVGGTVPGVDDIALWDATVTSAIGPVLGGDLSWRGIQITNPGAAVYIGASEGDASTLTLGASGIEASTFSQPLYLRAPVTLTAHQTWKFKGTTSVSIGVADAVSTVDTAGFTLTIHNGSVKILDDLTGSGGLTHTAVP